MEFCEERDSPNKGGRHQSRAAFLLSRFERIERDGQKAQIYPDGNSAWSSPGRSHIADGTCIVEA
jgi:hypothetical protein